MVGVSATWPEEDTRKLIELWRKGYSAGDCRKLFSGKYSRNSIIGKAHRLGLRRHGDMPPSLNIQNCWSQEKDALLAEHADRGMALSEIAAAMQASPKTILKHAARLGLSILRPQRGRAEGKQNNAPRKIFSSGYEERIGMGLLGGPIWAGKGMSLAEAPLASCRWPFDGNGSDGLPRCCGAARMGIEHPYCPDHARIAYPNVAKRELEAAA